MNGQKTTNLPVQFLLTKHFEKVQ